MERLNGEVRDREKVTRGLKKVDSPLLKGYQIYHNYIREHEGLNNDTPAKRCGIEIEGENKWFTIIQNATKNERKEKIMNNDETCILISSLILGLTLVSVLIGCKC